MTPGIYPKFINCNQYNELRLELFYGNVYSSVGYADLRILIGIRNGGSSGGGGDGGGRGALHVHVDGDARCSRRYAGADRPVYTSIHRVNIQTYMQFR